MHYLSTSPQELARIWLCFFLLVPFVLIFAIQDETMNSGNKVISIGVIIDVNSRIGKEQEVAMDIAAQSYNNTSKNYKVALYFQNSTKDTLSAIKLAEEMINVQKMQMIIGMQTWPEAGIVAEVGSKAQVPVISFAAPTITPPLMKTRWPFLVRLANNGTSYINCIVEIIQAYSWKRVVVIYEDDEYGGDYGMQALLAEALQEVDSMIEHRLVFPPISSLHDPGEVVLEEMIKLSQAQSRVFIVLQSSLEMAIHLFKEASKVGLMDKESVWITPESITNLLDSVNKSSISYMEGALGIKTFYSERSKEYHEFEAQFWRTFRVKNPDEDNRYPGFYALQAYDSIKLVTQAINRMTNKNNSSPKILLTEILSSNFLGLSGHIQLKDGQLKQNNIVLRIVNVAGKSYKELCFWTQQYGFTTIHHAGQVGKNKVAGSTECFRGVRWPGNLDRNPKGWNMPTKQSPLRIAVRSRTSFSKFVKVEYGQNGEVVNYTGLCIDIFDHIKKLLGYDLPYNYYPINGTYDDLVQLVYNKTYDAVVGDMTIIEERLKYVDFTVPYAESGLSMIVPMNSEESAWLFMKPFTLELWLVTGAILIYTMLVVWYLERESNPEFHGNWKLQLSTALWFTFSSLFFAHREKMHSNLTRVVMVSWLFLVLILTSSYTASLSSMLTVKQLRPNITDIQWLKNNNKKIGCDGDSFVRTFLENVEKFKPENIRNITNEYKYDEAFSNNSIAAAFLELPYEKVFTSAHCKKYTGFTPRNRFGGLGFMFQKGSPLTRDFSKAILHLSANAELKKLEEKWLITSHDCSNNVTTSNNTDGLDLGSLWVLYVISGATSTICVLISTIKCLQSSKPHEDLTPNGTPNDERVWKKAITFAKKIYSKKVNNSSEAHDVTDGSSRPGHVSISGNTEHSHDVAFPPKEVHMTSTKRVLEQHSLTRRNSVPM